MPYLLNFSRSVLWLTVSNAFARSKTRSFCSKLLMMLSHYLVKTLGLSFSFRHISMTPLFFSMQ